jgi:hypothetical protein
MGSALVTSRKCAKDRVVSPASPASWKSLKILLKQVFFKSFKGSCSHDPYRMFQKAACFLLGRLGELKGTLITPPLKKTIEKD